MKDKMKEFYIAQINEKMSLINPGLDSLNNAKSLDQIALHSDAIISILNQVREIQQLHSITMDPPLDQLISMIEKTRDIRATNLAIKLADLNIEKIKAIGNTKTQADLLDTAKMLVIDAKNLVSGSEFHAKLEAKMSELKSLG